MRIGVIGSSGGSVLAAMHDILAHAHPGKVTFQAVTDRECGMEKICRQRDLRHTRIENRDNAAFSAGAARFFAGGGGVDCVLLFFLRLVTAELFGVYPTFNLHPSLLPAFPGFGAIPKAIKTRVRFLGATLHLVSAGTDNGVILAQAVMPIAANESEEQLNKYSFVQKTALALVLYELMAAGDVRLTPRNADALVVADLPASDRLNPALRDPKIAGALAGLQRDERVDVIH